MTRFTITVLLSLVSTAAWSQAASGPMKSMHQLDSVYAIHGLTFGTAEGSVAGLQPQFSGIGKRWRTSHVYSLKTDTATLGSLPVQPEFWFRGGRLIGVTYQLPKEKKTRVIRQELIRLYGPPRPGNVANALYWLGQRTYILYEDAIPNVALHIASLDMLNEQVIETAVRQDARNSLGWQPDSLGLPRQFSLPSEKRKK